MSLEIRPITDDEIEQAEYITAYSFNSARRGDLTEAVEQAKEFYSNDWSLASFEDGEMTAFIRTIPFAIRINGHGLSFGAVGPVVSLPQHRRKGHVGALLRRGLEISRERGQVLSGLHTPHPTLYQRFGWEIASVRREYRFAPKEITLKAEPSERGKMRMLKPDDWAQADRVYRLHSADRNGALHRPEVWWRQTLFAAAQPTKGDVALWENAQGEPQGYMIYYQPRQPEEGMANFWVRELVALTRDAYLNLILYLLRHDLPKEILWSAPPYDPFLSLVDDARNLKVAEPYDLMLRICDVEMALKQRSPANAERPLQFTMRITDTTAPWNEGTWRIESAEGTTNVEKTDGEADLTLSATTLAPLFNGFLSPSAAAFSGRLEARNEDVLAEADAFFATLYEPFCSDGF